MSFFDILLKTSRYLPGCSKIMRLLYGCDIPRKVKIGKNVRFGHKALGVVIHKDSVIEDNVIIQHHVNIGMNKIGEPSPVIRKGAFIGPYAMILGDVEVGSDSIVGAGSIVMENIDPNGIYVNDTKIKKIGQKEK